VDLLISDINMPRMDGFTFIRTVREQDAYRDLPIIVLSTEGQEKDIQAGLRLGANMYMVKPAQPEKLMRNVKMLLG
jgi:two-component system chemotaxis response regulator CheY